jgi:hypothetical protein
LAAVVLLVLAGCSSPPPPTPSPSAPTPTASTAPEAAAPQVRIYDTGLPAVAPLSPEAVTDRKGWTLVAEGDTRHTFSGHAVLANDRVAVAVGTGAGWAQVFAITESGATLRAVVAPMLSLMPATPEEAATVPPGPRVKAAAVDQNTSGAGSLSVAFADGGREVTATYRLTMGQPILEVRPCSDAKRLSIRSRADYAVVPDYFGDDRIFAAAALAAPRTGLPAENFFLSLSGGGDGMMMCTWPSSAANADVLASGDGPDRAIAGYEVECVPGKPVWLAFMEGKRLWHAKAVESKTRETATLGPRWVRPFPAKWRATWYFPDYPDLNYSGISVADNVFCAHPRIICMGVEIMADDTKFRCMDKRGDIILYPIDRNAQTPLDIFTPMDVLRNTLGVGPCQYVLDSEGLGSTEATTPEVTAAWLEKRLKRSDAAAGPEIKARLDAMTAHVGRVRNRVDVYDHEASVIRDRLLAIGLKDEAESFNATVVIVSVLEGTAVKQSILADQMQERVTEVSARLLAAIEKKGKPVLSPKDAETLREAGADLDRALAVYRMAFRVFLQSARAVLWKEGVDPEVLKEVNESLLPKAREMIQPPVAEKKM